MGDTLTTYFYENSTVYKIFFIIAYLVVNYCLVTVKVLPGEPDGVYYDSL